VKKRKNSKIRKKEKTGIQRKKKTTRYFQIGFTLDKGIIFFEGGRKANG
jgi:putative sterol carrier protein